MENYFDIIVFVLFLALNLWVIGKFFISIIVTAFEMLYSYANTIMAARIQRKGY